MRYCFGFVSSHSVIGLKNPQVRQPIFRRILKVFTKLPDRVAQRRGQFVKTLKIQVKFILNSTRTQCDYLFITQRAKFCGKLSMHVETQLAGPQIKSTRS